MKLPAIIGVLLLPGVFVLGIDPVEPAPDPKGVTTERPRPAASGTIPPILRKLDLSADQEARIHSLFRRTLADQRAAGTDREKRRTIQKTHEQTLHSLLTERQQSELKRLRTPKLPNEGSEAPDRKAPTS